MQFPAVPRVPIVNYLICHFYTDNFAVGKEETNILCVFKKAKDIEMKLRVILRAMLNKS